MLCVDVLIVSLMYMMSNKAGDRGREGRGRKYLWESSKARRKRHRVRIGNSPTLQTSGRLMVFWPRSISPPTYSRCIMSACRHGKHIYISRTTLYISIYLYEYILHVVRARLSSCINAMKQIKTGPVNGVIGIPQSHHRFVQVLGRVEITDGADVWEHTRFMLCRQYTQTNMLDIRARAFTSWLNKSL